jgi:hypothetical protein
MLQAIKDNLVELVSLCGTIATALAYREKIKAWLMRDIRKENSEMKRDFEKAISENHDELIKINLIAARRELIYLIDHTPNNTMAISQAYDSYAELGGNSYATEKYEAWQRQIKKSREGTADSEQ